jgi:hypothetical protein
MAVKMAVVKNLAAMKGLQVAVNFGEGGSEGLPTLATLDSSQKRPSFKANFLLPVSCKQRLLVPFWALIS